MSVPRSLGLKQIPTAPGTFHQGFVYGRLSESALGRGFLETELPGKKPETLGTMAAREQNLETS